MKLTDIPKNWRHTKEGVWHQPRYNLRNGKYVFEWKVYYEGNCKRCNSKHVTPQIKRPYCNSVCANNAIKKFGKNHPRWKNGKCKVIGGYVLVRRSGSKEGYKQEHRVVMEKHLRRKLLPTEIVHHINENRWDNRLENLTIMTRAEHLLHHHFPDKIKD